MLDKDELKNNLTIEQVFDLVADLGGEPRMGDEYLISRTICHNPAGHGSHKLWYYNNTKLFRCYTECGDEAFDIFNLIQKINDCSLYCAIVYVASYFGYATSDLELKQEYGKLEDWKKINRYEQSSGVTNKQKVELTIYDDSILRYLPRPIILPWEREGIKREIMLKRGIAYDPVNEGIVIPHFDIYGKLIGIRERTLIREEESYGKYKPAKLNGKMYNHPLSFSLYNLNNSKENIKIIKKAIVFESELSL